MNYARKIFLLLIATIISGVLSSCAQYKVATNRAAGYEGRIERLSIWSSVGGIDLLGVKQGFVKASFSDRFDAALKLNCQNENIRAEVHKFNPKNHTKVEFEPAEQELRPNTRLLIQPTRYQTATFKGGTWVSGLWLDLQLMDIASKRLVWHGSVFMDPGLDPTAWLDSGADKLSKQVIDALKKDKLI